MTTVTEHSTPLLDRARAATFGARTPYVGSDEHRTARTDAAAQLCVLAITEMFPREHHETIAAAVRGLLGGEHPSEKQAVALLLLGCRLYAEGGITDLDRLLFSEVALCWHRPLTRLDALLSVQVAVDEWHRADQSPDREQLEAETNVERYREEWWTEATTAAQVAVRADHAMASALR